MNGTTRRNVLTEAPSVRAPVVREAYAGSDTCLGPRAATPDEHGEPPSEPATARWRPSPYTAVMAVAASGLVITIVEVKAQWWAPVAWTAAALLIMAAVTLEAARNRGTAPAPSTTAGLDSLADQLARAVQAQWRREQAQREVTDPASLPVRWHPAAADLVNDPATSFGYAAAPSTGRAVLDEIGAIYRRAPSGRLVILGKAGSGKTVLAARLALDLLATRRAADPVPVLVSVGSWNPATPLTDWLAGQLERDHPWLAGPRPGKPGLMAALISANRVLPILDGFDEIDADLRLFALSQLNTGGLPLVLTSRREEYRRAARAVAPLAAAAIELDDLALDDLADYLSRTTWRRVAGARTGVWQLILAHLQDQPQDPAAAVLRPVMSTPLMVYLARTIYSDSADHIPTELLDTSRFPTPGALRQHLLTTYLAVVYEQPVAAGRTWPVDQVARWLTYLAHHIDELYAPVPVRRQRGLAAGLALRIGDARRLMLVRLWLPVTGRLPWSVSAFLADAHRRGVLRQAGAVYQFRHARIRDHLAHAGPRPTSSPGTYC
ncbi:MAG: hypothetical protein QOI74_2367 [Micromonosporaceae bacterium]|nr:hypothetical protein [Micromonosporaceae bacterium]